MVREISFWLRLAYIVYRDRNVDVCWFSLTSFVFKGSVAFFYQSFSEESVEGRALERSCSLLALKQFSKQL